MQIAPQIANGAFPRSALATLPAALANRTSGLRCSIAGRSSGGRRAQPLETHIPHFPHALSLLHISEPQYPLTYRANNAKFSHSLVSIKKKKYYTLSRPGTCVPRYIGFR